MIQKLRQNFFKVLPDIIGGFSGGIVALPSAIAFGLSVYEPLGTQYIIYAAFSGIVGTIVLGIVASYWGGTPRLVSAPCAPAAAVLSLFTLEEMRGNLVPTEYIPLLLTLAILLAGLFQLLIGSWGGGKLIKFIPYPVVAGYLSGVGILIAVSQIPKLLGIHFTKINLEFIHQFQPSLINILIGFLSGMGMVYGHKLTKRVPPAAVAITLGTATYFLCSFFDPGLLIVKGNEFIVGQVIPDEVPILNLVFDRWKVLENPSSFPWKSIIVPAFTLAFLLSIDTLKTCIVIDNLTQSRHDSNKEIRAQGIANSISALCGGLGGAGTMGASMVNLSSGGKTKWSGIMTGVFALLVFVFFSSVLQWIPVASLAGILIVIGFRMIDWKMVRLAKNPATSLDFFVILSVVFAAISTSLIMAAVVGILMSIVLFLRDQVRSSVIKRSFLGAERFSKKRRLSEESEILKVHCYDTIVFELQGHLFFGTTDQLFSVVEPYITSKKFIILDMRSVRSVDYTAVHMIKQLHSRIQSQFGTLVFTSIPSSLSTGDNLKSYLESNGLGVNTPNLLIFSDLDTALENIEEKILEVYLPEAYNDQSLYYLPDFSFFSEFSFDAIKDLESLCEEISFHPGDMIFKKGTTSDEIFFIRKGNVRITLPLDETSSLHLATFGKGDFFGDMGFLDLEPRSADALAEGTVALFKISRSNFQTFTEKHPSYSALFFENMALVIVQRLRLNHLELSSYQER